MTDLYVLASIPNQGKTTTAILLGEYFQKMGKKVANIQAEKGPFDVNVYLEKNCYHYTIPLEAAKNKKSFGRWLPKGYDVYILEITHTYSPIGVAYVDLFEKVNEIISFDMRDSWSEFVPNQMYEQCGRTNHANSDIMELWELFHKRTVKKVFTKTPEKTDDASVDDSFNLIHPEKFVSNEIYPEYLFPKSNKTTIAVGVFPAEYWDIFPGLYWYHFNYAEFMQRLRKGDFDLAIIGVCGAENLKLHSKPKTGEVICYQPSVYQNLNTINSHDLPLQGEFMSVFQAIKNEPVGTPIGKKGGCFAAFNNKYWTFKPNAAFEQIKKEGNILFCNGWILPQYLIRDGYLEVN